MLVSALVTFSAFSSLNGIMLSSPRVFFAMAEDGLFFAPLARFHGRFRTPYLAILLAAVLGMILVFSRTFETLTNTFVLAIWPFYALTVAAVFRLRRTRPALARPYHVPGYPIVPAIFILAVVGFVANALVTEPVSTASPSRSSWRAFRSISCVFRKEHVPISGLVTDHTLNRRNRRACLNPRSLGDLGWLTCFFSGTFRSTTATGSRPR